ncbi:hypothetical protein P170DRAFT_406305 [Aspergillus steynii IBT 23096]|uniref:Rhodopsin domain-containing protein n=1 Tax=Aspergillus steynii IBT 23096 TaxID=1392250 RepID=A0A2I2GDC1_9EURO|nr:uncharacterized protein P170DRAFT_406305 [Aspergillus steynii IBT 23096]PLB50872.1 hypothetical protein P170DRAFT_406305 [Aspergillus steynii IBT 23096]
MNKLVISLKVFFASEWFFVTAVAAFRLAIICLYLELFQVAWFYRCAITTIVLVVLYWLASILTITLLCRPINSNWNPTIERTCGNVAKTEYASAGFNLAVDLLVVTLPMPIVWKLQMTEKKKFGVTAAFLLGLITAGINIGRIIQTKLCDHGNTTYCALDASILIAAEISSGILVSCVPTLGPVLFRNRTRAYIERSSRKVRTIGSSGRRTWGQRRPQSTTLLNSHDDDEYELSESQAATGVQITSPTSCHFGKGDPPRTDKYSTGIMVVNETSVSEKTAPMGRQQGTVQPYPF